MKCIRNIHSLSVMSKNFERCLWKCNTELKENLLLVDELICTFTTKCYICTVTNGLMVLKDVLNLNTETVNVKIYKKVCYCSGY